jgi:hypothetical protein
MLNDLVNTTADIARTSTVSGKQVYASASTGSRCRIEPASDYVAAVNEAQYGQAFKVFFDRSVDVRTNDKLTIDGVVYEVRGVKDMLGRASSLSHKEVLAIRNLKQ